MTWIRWQGSSLQVLCGRRLLGGLGVISQEHRRWWPESQVTGRGQLGVKIRERVDKEGERIESVTCLGVEGSFACSEPTDWAPAVQASWEMQGVRPSKPSFHPRVWGELGHANGGWGRRRDQLR